MAKHVVSLTVNAQGKGDTYGLARNNALLELRRAARRLANQRTVDSPAVNVDDRDPGGGGGPCAPFQYSVEVIIDQTVLPDAVSRDDDDD